jgi:hypothetical protein
MSDNTAPEQTRPAPPAFEEEIALGFGKLLIYLADTLGAPSFAADVAEGGYKPGWLRTMANCWRDADLDGDGDEALEEFADALSCAKA